MPVDEENLHELMLDGLCSAQSLAFWMSTLISIKNLPFHSMHLMHEQAASYLNTETVSCISLFSRHEPAFTLTQDRGKHPGEFDLSGLKVL